MPRTPRALLLHGGVNSFSGRGERYIRGTERVDPPDDDPRAVWPHRMAIEFTEADATLQSLFEPASSQPPQTR